MEISKAKAFIFDMDGVVFDSEKNWQNAAVDADMKFCTGFDESVRIRCCGMDERSARSMLREFKPELDVDAYRDYIIDSVKREESKNGATVKRGILELITLLKKLNIKTALATSSSRVRVENLFDKAHIDHTELFQAVLTRDDVTRAKPDPDIFLKTAKAIGVEPSDTVVLEDSVNGLTAAERGGFIPIMIIDLIPPPPAMIKNGLVFYADVYPIISTLTKGEKQ